MIFLASERIVSLTEATSLLPRRRRGRKPNVATLYRWSKVGCRGVTLETVQVGGTRCTSVEALQRFIDKLTGAPVSDAPTRDSVQEAKRRARVDGELDAAGL